ncbi:hypothetical protein F9856_10110 [Streptococcus suis]|uniref:hypothetical protein n=1 Tax=Streptococcus suis TaxID=1307 RepID=UPI001923C8A6|nr:hypothetical protein [Streptococcus suis]MBL1126470.1 hypothetical protein [Streptococcus suis]MDN2948908.1 hypothetical protein [Streptococcus suis]HEL1564153.1 hypothetical protein [Streptococcus suis]HEL1598306.1 hypothetical protein [Streptococcus suis]HEL1909723.1 hypothetical protein [Streptococcus suis]
MNEKANRLYCQLLSFGDTGQLLRSASSRYLAGVGGWLYNVFRLLRRHKTHQTSSGLEVV